MSEHNARTATGAILAAVLGSIAVAAARDVLLTLVRPPEDWSVASAIFLSLYALPAVIALHQRLDLRSPDWRDRFFFHFEPSVPLSFCAGVALLLIALSTPLTSTQRAHQAALTNQQAIFDAAQRHHVDPQLLASIVVVNQRDYTSPFRSTLENVSSQLMVSDWSGEFLIGTAVDPSLGLAQVKADTLILAHLLSHPDQRWRRKGFRTVLRRHPAAFAQITDLRLLGVFYPVDEKGDVVDALTNDVENLEAAAFILESYQEQWRQVHDLRNDPAVLATLYQIGFEHSFPKTDPQANAFGEAVAREMNTAWMAQNFGLVPLHARR